MKDLRLAYKGILLGDISSKNVSRILSGDLDWHSVADDELLLILNNWFEYYD